MAQFRSSKRAKELKRAARHKAKEARKRERQKNAAAREPGDDIDWSQAVGIPRPETEGAEVTEGVDPEGGTEAEGLAQQGLGAASFKKEGPCRGPARSA